MNDRSLVGHNRSFIENKEIFLTINPMNLSEEDGRLLYDLFLYFEKTKVITQKYEQVQVGNVTYHLIFQLPIQIERDLSNNTITNLYVIEYINANHYYRDDIITSSINLDFSFLKIINYHGRLVVGDNPCFYYQSYKTPKLYFECEQTLDPKNASLAKRYFIHDMLEMIYQDLHSVKDTRNNTMFIPHGYLRKGKHLLKINTKNGQVIIRMELNSTIALRSSYRYEDEYRADVIGGDLGHGGYACVQAIEGTFKRHTFFSKPGKYVLKDYVVSDDKSLIKNSQDQKYLSRAFAFKNSETGSYTEHLKTSWPTIVFMGFEEHWQIREKRLNGIELYEFLNSYTLHCDHLPKRPYQITIDVYLLLLYEAALALLKQYHFKGIVHRDIKPDNILIDRAQCHIFDTNLAKFINEDDGQVICGALDYISPEKIQKRRSSHKSDVFSLMRSLVYLLGDGMPGKAQAFAPENFKPTYPLLNVLVANNKLHKHHADVIKAIFNAAFIFDVNDRCDIEFIINSVSLVIWERKLSIAYLRLSDFHYSNLILAHKMALQVLKYFLNYRKVFNENNEAVYLPKCISNVRAIDLLTFNINIKFMLNQLIDHPYILSEFCKTSGIYAIRDKKTKHEILSVISQICDQYVEQISELNTLHSGTANANKRAVIENILNLRRNYSFNLDNIKKISEIFSSYIRKLKANPPIRRPNSGLLKHAIMFKPNIFSSPAVSRSFPSLRK